MNAIDLLPEYVLGTLSEDEKRELEKQLAASPELRAEEREVRETFAMLGAAITPVAPSPAVKDRIMKSVSADRFAPLAVSLSKYFDLAVEKTRELLRLIDDPKGIWEDGPMPGIRLMHFSGGPRVATADVGFVRLPRGLHFPWHRHLGTEVNFVIEGSIRDFDGRVYGPGEAIEKAAGTEHEFFVGDDCDLIVGVVIDQGFEIIPRP